MARVPENVYIQTIALRQSEITEHYGVRILKPSAKISAEQSKTAHTICTPGVAFHKQMDQEKWRQCYTES